MNTECPICVKMNWLLAIPLRMPHFKKTKKKLDYDMQKWKKKYTKLLPNLRCIGKAWGKIYDPEKPVQWRISPLIYLDIEARREAVKGIL
jgi:hypothetical protein